MQRVKTVRDAFRQASESLRAAGLEGYTLEAEWMLRRLLGVDRARLFTMWNEPWPASLSSRLAEWVMRRENQEPLQYIFGDQEFYGRLFHVNPSVLIPRPETEELVETVLSEAKARFGDEPITVVDVGTGSGAIAVTLALERPFWNIVATDLSHAALAVARANARRHGVEERIVWLHGSFLEPVSGAGISFDVLVSNPPYIPSDEVPGLEAQVSRHEPHLALDGGVDGLSPYRAMAEQLSRLPRRRRLLCFEIGADQGKAVPRILRERLELEHVRVISDLAGRDRVVAGWMKA